MKCANRTRNLRKKWTLSLLTNPEVLRLETDCFGAEQVERDDTHAVWVSHDKDGGTNLALFNLSDQDASVGIALNQIELKGRQSVRDLWKRTDLEPVLGSIGAEIPAHGAVLYQLTPAK